MQGAQLLHREAMLYQRRSQGRVRCGLCAHRCFIAEGKSGICRVRENRGGTLYTRVYGRTIAEHVDPVEKKPLYHLYPGSTSYSIATPGCNLRCPWCQNWEIAHEVDVRFLSAGREAPPEQIVAAARAAGCRSIAYTYTEPTIFFEYAHDTARLARAAGLANVFVTNGYMTGEMLDALHPCLDAANVDLKSFREETYRRQVGARLGPVLDSLRKMKQLGVWVEVTTLVIPGINDDPEELRDAAGFIAKELGPNTPWHLSRFFPAYRMTDRPPTSLEILERVRQIAGEAGLRYIYVGNVAGEQNTHCHRCGQRLIRRAGYRILENRVNSLGRCPTCGTPLAGVGMVA